MKNKREVAFMWLGFLITIAVVVGGVILLIYWVLGNFEYNQLRMIAEALIFALPAGVWLGLRIGREHSKGVEKGIDMKIGAASKMKAATQPQQQPKPAAPDYSALLPQRQQLPSKATIIYTAGQNTGSDDAITV